MDPNQPPTLLPPLPQAPLYEYSFPSVSNMLSSWCQYEALSYVTFPTQVGTHSYWTSHSHTHIQARQCHATSTALP